MIDTVSEGQAKIKEFIRQVADAGTVWKKSTKYMPCSFKTWSYPSGMRALEKISRQTPDHAVGKWNTDGRTPSLRDPLIAGSDSFDEG
jgi:hypothetical protein